MSDSKPEMRLQAIAYVSSAVERLAPAQLDDILEASWQRNHAAGVTGVLLYHDGSFFQYLEGPPEGLARVYARTRGSQLHHGLVELLDQPVTGRLFPDWLMGFCEAPRSVLQELTHASWVDSVQELQARDDRSDGVSLLLDFWNRSSRQPD